MNTAAAPTTISPTTTAKAQEGHIGLVVLGSIAAGLAIGLLLVLGVFAGGSDPQTIGSALVGLGAGFALLALTSTRRTNQRDTTVCDGMPLDSVTATGSASA